MVVREELINRIRQLFGLNLYEARIWVALLARGVATAGELSDLANVPRSRTYDVLESLEKKGFVVMKVGKPIKYMAVPPHEVLERLKKSVMEEAKRRAEMLEGLKESDLIKELEEIYQKGIQMVEPSEITGALRGRHNLFNHMETMFKSAEESIYILTTETAIVRKIDAFKPLFEKLANRGVKILVVAPITKENAKYIKDLEGVAEVYDAGDLRGRFIAVDRKEILLMIADDREIHPSYDIGIWLNAPFLASALQSLLEHVVKNLKPAKQKLKELGVK